MIVCEPDCRPIGLGDHGNSVERIVFDPREIIEGSDAAPRVVDYRLGDGALNNCGQPARPEGVAISQGQIRGLLYAAQVSPRVKLADAGANHRRRRPTVADLVACSPMQSFESV